MVKIAVCQLEASPVPADNVETVRKTVLEHSADVYLFPELFMTRYGCHQYTSEVLHGTLDDLTEISMASGNALAVSMPWMSEREEYDSLFFITPDGTTRYDKIHLANFGPYDESNFEAGKKPTMVDWKGLRFGLLICYDIMFPELSRHYAVNGADVILMSSASLESSRNAMGTILPARSLENTVYTVFCNNAGKTETQDYFGGSAVYSPTGDRLAMAGKDSEILVVDLDKETVSRARKARCHLRDFRRDIDWL